MADGGGTDRAACSSPLTVQSGAVPARHGSIATDAPTLRPTLRRRRISAPASQTPFHPESPDCRTPLGFSQPSGSVMHRDIDEPPIARNIGHPAGVRSGARSHRAGGKPRMLKLSLRSAIAHWRRLLLTTLAIVLGVAFVIGSFVLSDSLGASINRLIDSSAGRVDLVVADRRTPTSCPAPRTESGPRSP